LPLLHVDSTWEFSDVLEFRAKFASENNFELIVHHNKQGRKRGLNPIDHGALYTSIMRTEALKQALDGGGYDVIFGGARRDEEVSRAKERIVSVRSQYHGWDPKNQRPELWSIFNWRRSREQSLRVFPLSNWTEHDLWEYIMQEKLQLCPLYFAADRTVAETHEGLILIDDPERAESFDFGPTRVEKVRFRSLGCWPVTSAQKSEADSLLSVLNETLSARSSERSGRVSDGRSLESQKSEGYF